MSLRGLVSSGSASFYRVVVLLCHSIQERFDLSDTDRQSADTPTSGSWRHKVWGSPTSLRGLVSSGSASFYRVVVLLCHSIQERFDLSDTDRQSADTPTSGSWRHKVWGSPMSLRGLAGAGSASLYRVVVLLCHSIPERFDLSDTDRQSAGTPTSGSWRHKVWGSPGDVNRENYWIRLYWHRAGGLLSVCNSH